MFSQPISLARSKSSGTALVFKSLRFIDYRLDVGRAQRLWGWIEGVFFVRLTNNIGAVSGGVQNLFEIRRPRRLTPRINYCFG